MRPGRLLILVFVVLQIADGLITFGAVRIFGSAAEANPILLAWFGIAGPAATLLVAKSVACGAAALLYSIGFQKTLAGLTALQACSAVLPWLAVLATFH